MFELKTEVISWSHKKILIVSIIVIQGLEMSSPGIRTLPVEWRPEEKPEGD